ncbi:MAG: toll/interleukin-1 receptor domain-containing protein, partial [Candidatus Tectomicrobia bacterium]
MHASDRSVIYISYRWHGAKAIADSLTAELSAALPDVDVFQDSASLQPGDHWPTRLQEALNLASVLLVLIDHDWLRYADEYGRRRLDDPEDWVRLEIERALGRDVRIIPILLDDAVLPPAQGLPESLRPLTLFQAVPLRSSGPGAIADRIRG